MMLITVVEEGTASITKQRNIYFMAICLEDRDYKDMDICDKIWSEVCVFVHE